jgi:hypothetical protein
MEIICAARKRYSRFPILLEHTLPERRRLTKRTKHAGRPASQVIHKSGQANSASTAQSNWRSRHRHYARVLGRVQPKSLRPPRLPQRPRASAVSSCPEAIDERERRGDAAEDAENSRHAMHRCRDRSASRPRTGPAGVRILLMPLL